MLKKQKGITLIALIITIIVMLILVGVTINVALNGGLFSKASDAAIETEKRAILEQIIALSEWDNDGKINVKVTVDNVKEEFGEDKVVTNPATVTSSTTEVIVAITGKHGAYNYKITTKEITITNAPGLGPVPPQEPEEYYFTFNMLNEIADKQIKYETINEANKTSTSMLLIDSEAFWNKVGWDLSGKYGVGGNMQKIDPDKSIVSSDTGAFAEYYAGAETVSSDKLENLFLFQANEDNIMIVLVKNPGEEIDFGEPTNVKGIVSATGTEAEELLSWEEFLTAYGDIKFYFEGTKKVDLSTLSDLEKLQLYFVDNLLFSFTDDSGLMNTDFTFKNTTTILGDKPLELKGAFGVEYEKTTVKYNDKYYIVSGENYQCKSVEEANLTMQQISNENLGKYVEYDSNGDGTAENWIILYNDGTNGIQLLSTTVSSENYTLEGFNGYNNAVQILNTACDELVTETIYKQSVRTIGSNPASTKDNPLDGENVADGTLKSINENYISDFTRMTALNVIVNSDDDYYWFAARQKPYNRTSDIIYFIAIAGNSSGMNIFANGDRYIISYDGTSYREHRDSNRVLPVVTLKSGVTINTEGHTGLANDPYTLQ